MERRHRILKGVFDIRVRSPEDTAHCSEQSRTERHEERALGVFVPGRGRGNQRFQGIGGRGIGQRVGWFPGRGALESEKPEHARVP